MRRLRRLNGQNRIVLAQLPATSITPAHGAASRIAALHRIEVEIFGIAAGSMLDAAPPPKPISMPGPRCHKAYRQIVLVRVDCRDAAHSARQHDGL